MLFYWTAGDYFNTDKVLSGLYKIKYLKAEILFKVVKVSHYLFEIIINF